MYVGVGPPPPPGTAGWAAPAQTPLPARRPRRGRGGLGKWASVPSPPRKAISFPPCRLWVGLVNGTREKLPGGGGTVILSKGMRNTVRRRGQRTLFCMLHWNCSFRSATVLWCNPPPPQGGGGAVGVAWRLENCSAGGGGGGGGHGRPPKEGRGGLEKWGSVSGPLFCVRTDVGAKGAGTQILARKSFFHQ